MVSLPDGVPSTEGFGGLVEGARKAACGVWRTHPAWMAPWLNTPIGERSLARGLIDNICRDHDLPPAPQVQFSGGQCDLVAYAVTVRLVIKSVYGTTSSSDTSFTVWGKVGGLGSGKLPSGASYIDIGCRGASNQSPLLPGSRVEVGRTTGADFWYSSYSIISCVRADGQPDTCGDPPENWHDDSPPTEAETNVTIVNNFHTGGSVSLPAVILPPVLKGEINVKIGAINVNFKVGKIEVKMPDGFADDPDSTYDDTTLQSKVDNISNQVTNVSGGVNTSISLSNDIKNQTDKIPDLKTAIDGNRTAIDDNTQKVDDLGKKVDALKKPLEPPDSEKYDQDPKDPDDPKDEDGIVKFKWLRITLTKLPEEGKVILKSNGQIVTYAGWVEFRARGHGLPRVQIQFPDSIFPVPEGADGYSYTLTHGAQGFATVIKEKVPVS